MKFRIKKTEEINGLGKTNTEYVIQKKFLWFWFDYKHDFPVYKDYNLVSINRQKIETNNLYSAKDWIRYIQKTNYEFYKGKLILTLYNYRFEPIYILKDNYKCVGDKWGYECSNSVDNLKKIVDESIKKNVVSYIQI